MLNALAAFLRRFLPADRDSTALDALTRRVAALEAQIGDCLEITQLEAERAARWADMSQQLRRFLGRLDAHAGKQREQEEQNGGRDPKQLAAILRTKFPHSGA